MRKSRRNSLGKAIKVFTPNTTQLTDQQKRDCVPIFLPAAQIPMRPITEREIAISAAQSSAGQTLTQIKQFLYEKHTTTGRQKAMARVHFKNSAHLALQANGENTRNKSTALGTRPLRPAGPAL